MPTHIATPVGFALLGCAALADPPSGGSNPDAPTPTIHFDPPPNDGYVAPVVHIKIGYADPAAARDDIVVAQGSLSSRDLSDLAQHTATDALRRRLVDAMVWLDGDGVVTVAPSTALE